MDLAAVKASMTTAAHLSDDTIVELSAGTLGRHQFQAAHQHLDQCATCRRLVAAVSRAVGPSEDADTNESDERPAEIDLPVGRGTSIGRYLVTRVVGAGAMGVVYAAHDPELDRCVAIKLVHEGVGQSWSRAREDRLRSEAKAMARLVHPNVVHVYDVGAHGSRTFIAMELVEGVTLTQWLREAPRSTDAITACFAAAGRGLAAAHEGGLLHRDFKPDNVFVSGDGRVVVGDFGLAREVARPDLCAQAPLDAGASQTRSGRIAGTPAYLAPEVLGGEEPSVASDQFSFCVSLWEGVYGERPFSGRTLLELHQRMRARDPSSLPARRVPAWLRRVLLRGLDPDPAARHPSMAALLQALDRRPRRVRLVAAAALALPAAALFAVGVVRPARPSCSGAASELAPAWSEPRRAALGAAFRAAGQEAAWPAIDRALGRFAGSWIDVHTRSCRATRIEGHQSDDVLERRTRCLTEQREVVAALGDLWLPGAPALLAKAPSALEALPLPAVCGGDGPLNAPKMAEPAPGAAAKVGDLRRTLSLVKARLAAADPQAALALARDVVKGAKDVAYAPLEAEALIGLSSALKYHGDFTEAERALHDATFAAVAGGHEQALAEAMVMLANTAVFDRGRLDDGQVLLARAAPVVARLGDRRLFAELEIARARVQFERGEIEGAQATLLSLLPQLESIFGRDHYQASRVEGQLFQCAFRLSRPLEARAHAEEALQILERTLPPDHVHLYPALMSRAVPEFDLGDVRATRRLFERAWHVAEKAQGPDGPGVAAALANLANVLSIEGEVNDARAAAERALRIAVEKRGVAHPLTAYVEVVLGDLLWETGSAGEAVAHLVRALELREQRYGRRHVDTAEVLGLLGRARLDTGDAGGLAVVLEADRIVRELAANSSRREHAARYACEVLLESDQPEEAAPHCQRMLAAARENRAGDHPWVINARRLVAELSLSRGRAVSDRAELESGVAALQERGGWPRMVADGQFVLARVLASAEEPAARSRASQLARAALAAAQRTGMRQSRVAAMEAFLEKEMQP